MRKPRKGKRKGKAKAPPKELTPQELAVLDLVLPFIAEVTKRRLQIEAHSRQTEERRQAEEELVRKRIEEGKKAKKIIDRLRAKQERELRREAKKK